MVARILNDNNMTSKFLDGSKLRIGNIVNQVAMAHWLKSYDEAPRIPGTVQNIHFDFDVNKYVVGRVCYPPERKVNDKNVSTAMGSIPVEPIPITEDWLEKLGCILYKGGDIWEELKISDMDDENVWFVCSGFYYIVNERGEYWHLYHQTDEDTNWQIGWYKYVHELQNVIFALCGTELTCKDND
jgi:hypothetical protein